MWGLLTDKPFHIAEWAQCQKQDIEIEGFSLVFIVKSGILEYLERYKHSKNGCFIFFLLFFLFVFYSLICWYARGFISSSAYRLAIVHFIQSPGVSSWLGMMEQLKIFRIASVSLRQRIRFPMSLVWWLRKNWILDDNLRVNLVRTKWSCLITRLAIRN